MTTTSRPARLAIVDRLKHLSYQSFSAVSHDRVPQLPGSQRCPAGLLRPSVGATSTVRYRPFARCDRSKTRWNSPWRLTRRAFEKRSDGHGMFRGTEAPRAITRRKPRGACALLRGAASAPGGHSSSPSAPEIRASACGAGGLAGTSHSLSDPLRRKERERRNLNSNQAVVRLSIDDEGCRPSEIAVLQSASPAARRP